MMIGIPAGRRLTANLVANRQKYGIRYVIHNMRIWSARNWGGRPYTPITNTGDFRHTAHVHASYRKGTNATREGTSLVGEEGPELLRVRSGSQVQTNRATLDYLSRIEALAVNAPRDMAAMAAGSPVPQAVAGITNAPVSITMPIYYPKSDEVPTMAAQRQIVRAGRAAFTRRSNDG